MLARHRGGIVAAEIQEQKESFFPIKLIVIFTILVAGILAASYLSYRGYEKQYRAKVEHELSVIADLKVAELVQWRSERMGDAEIIYKNTTFSNLVRRYLNNPQDVEAERQLREWLDQYLKHTEYDQVRLFDPRGITRMSFPAGQPPASATVKNSIAEVLRSGLITIIDLYRNEHDHRIYLSVLIPILDVSGGNQAIGVLSLRVDPEKYLFPFILRWPTPSQTAETLLVRRDGNNVLFLRDLKFRKGAALKFRIPLNKTDAPPVMAVLGRTGIVEGKDYQGVPVVADIRSVPNSPWFLIIRMDTSEMHAPAREQLWMIIGFVAALLFGSGMGLAFVWRQQSVGFYRERYQAAEALRENEKKLTSITSNMAEGLYVLDDAGRFVFLNPEAERLLGWTINEVYEKGPHAHDLVHFRRADGTLLPLEECNIHTVIKTGKRHSSTDEVFVRKDGYVFPVSVISAPIVEGGKVVASITVFQDITERKQAEDALRKSEAELKEAQRVAHIGSWDWDAITDIIQWSAEYYNIFNLDPKEPLPNYIEHLKVYTPESRERLDAAVKKAMQTGEPYELDLELANPDVTRRWIVARGEVKRNADGRIVGLRGTAQNITGRKQAEEALKMLNQALQSTAKELEFAYKNMESFSYSISHDLRAPLRITNGLSDVMLKDYHDKLDDEGKKLLKLIHENTQRMDQLVLALLELSRVGRQEMKINRIDMEKAATLIAGDLKAMAPERNIDVNIKTLPPAYGDLTLIRQVLANLLSNAVKFTKDRDIASIEVGSRREGNENIYYVKDNGAGFDMEQANRLYKVFQRLHSLNEFEGIGIGLSIVQRIIQRHGGRVWAEGKPGKGATFYFSLPGKRA